MTSNRGEKKEKKKRKMCQKNLKLQINNLVFINLKS